MTCGVEGGTETLAVSYGVESGEFCLHKWGEDPREQRDFSKNVLHKWNSEQLMSQVHVLHQKL